MRRPYLLNSSPFLPVLPHPRIPKCRATPDLVTQIADSQTLGASLPWMVSSSLAAGALGWATLKLVAMPEEISEQGLDAVNSDEADEVAIQWTLTALISCFPFLNWVVRETPRQI